MAKISPKNVGELVALSYANLARAHAAKSDGSTKYERKHHIIRSKLYYGLLSGKLHIRSIFDDVKWTVKEAPRCCVYCGEVEHLSLDHLIPRIRLGGDGHENLVLACRSCNSSKGSMDLMRWMSAKDSFPSIMVLRKYLKIVASVCSENEIMLTPIENLPNIELEFDLGCLPTKYPPLDEIVVWVVPRVKV